MANKKPLQWMSRIREFVFGMQDGVISTVGFLSGVQSAMEDQKVVVIAGLAQILTGALSMGIGAYLSTKAEKEVLEGIQKGKEAGWQEEPYLAQEQLLRAFEEEGLRREEGYRIVTILTKNAEVFRRTFHEKVLGIGSAAASRPVLAAGVMYLSFLVGGTFPISPYFFWIGKTALILSVALSAAALFATGFFKGVLAKKSPWRSGLEFFLIALISAMAGYGIGILLGIPTTG